MAKVTRYKNKTVTKTVTTRVPAEVELTLPFEVFVALVAHWSQSFGGYDPGVGLRDQVDSYMRSAWVDVTGRKLLDRDQLRGAVRDSATANAQAWIDKITELLGT